MKSPLNRLMIGLERAGDISRAGLELEKIIHRGNAIITLESMNELKK